MDLQRELTTFWSVYSVQRRDIDRLPQQALLPVVDPALLLMHFPQLLLEVDRGDWTSACDTLPQQDVARTLAAKLRLPMALLGSLLPSFGDEQQHATRWQLRLLERALWPRAKPHPALAEATAAQGWLLLRGAAAAAAARELSETGDANCVMYLTLAQIHLRVPPAKPWRDTRRQLHLASCYRDAYSGTRFLREALTPSVMLPRDYEHLFSALDLRRDEHKHYVDGLLQKLADTEEQLHPLVIHLAKKERPHELFTARAGRRGRSR